MIRNEKKIVLASNNPGKIHEFKMLLSPFEIEILPQHIFGIEDVEETGLTFVENAIIKARHACEETEYAALADDSGLSVDYLNGEPGIFSARYAGNKDPQANIEKLLLALENVPEQNRSASFHCVLVLMNHAKDPIPLICEASWKGRILTAPQGEGGFGYDPIFWVTSENKSAAELPNEIKNKISHRGQALQMLMQKLSK